MVEVIIDGLMRELSWIMGVCIDPPLMILPSYAVLMCIFLSFQTKDCRKDVGDGF